MCRHAAYLGEPLSVDTLLTAPQHGLFAQSYGARELLRGSVCGDGFGVGWFARDAAEPATYRRGEPIWSDPDLPNVGAAVRAECVVASVRNATPGAPGGRDAVMPFALDGVLFAHNGLIEGFEEHARALREGLPDELYRAQRCGSDAEALFLATLGRRRAGADLLDAVTLMLDHVASAAPGSALNVIAAERNRIVATRLAAGCPADSLYVLHRSGLAPNGTIVASEPLDADPAWTSVPQGSAVVVELGADPVMVKLGAVAA